jgi:nucleoside-diphosphate-sugar epimerase
MRRAGGGFVNWFIRLALENKKINIYEKGRFIRDLNYIDDVLCALLLVAADERSNGKFFNLGGPEALSIREIAGQILKITKLAYIKVSHTLRN